MADKPVKLICLTRHGEQRAKERLGLKKRNTLKRVQWVYDHGIHMKHPCLKKSVYDWMRYLHDNLRYDWHPEVVLYGHHAYLYSEYNFVTVIPAPHHLIPAIDDSLYLWRVWNETE